MKLAEFLVRNGLASEQEISSAIAMSARAGGDLVTNLIDVASSTHEESLWLAALSDAFGLEAVKPGPLPPPTDAAKKALPSSLAIELEVIPLELDGDTLVFAASKPLDDVEMRAVVDAAGGNAWAKIALELRIRSALSAEYGSAEWPRTEALHEKLANASRRSSSERAGATAPEAQPGNDASPEAEASLVERVDRAFEDVEAAEDADAVLAVLFHFAHAMFGFTALLTAPGEFAEGKLVHDGSTTVSSPPVKIPVLGPSVLATARSKGGAVATSPTTVGFDRLLFAQLKHTPKNAVVVAPVFVGPRAVAFVVGDAGEAGLSPSKFAGLAAVAKVAGHRLERTVLRRRVSGSFVPRAPYSTPRALVLRGAPPPSTRAVRQVEAQETPFSSHKAPTQPWTWMAIAAAAAIAAALGARPLLARLHSLAALDPFEMLDEARASTGLSPTAKLAALEMMVDANGKLPRNVDEGDTALDFIFVDGTNVVDARLGADGKWSAVGATSDLPLCANAPCALATPAPHCSLESLWGEALRFGARRRDIAKLTLEVSSKGAVWSFAVVERGELLIDDATCKRHPRSRLAPPPRPVAEIAGAPYAVDPLANIAMARAQAGLEDDSELDEITIRYTDRSGHVDLDGRRWMGTVDYVFSDPQGGTAPRRRRRVVLGRDGLGIATDAPAATIESVPLPTCDLATVLRISKSVTDDIVVDYGPREGKPEDGGEWRVRADKTRYTILDKDCVASRDGSHD